MNNEMSRLSRPLVSTVANNRRHSALRSTFNRPIPRRVLGSLSRRLHQLQQNATSQPGESSIDGIMIESLEQAPEDEAKIVSGLIASFQAAKERQAGIVGSDGTESP